ncbi:MAG: hypothetical protein CMO20_06660 [Thermoplasmata archaeon]|nr:hypothetical protein [Thermoplasmata archaeon]
MLPILVAHPMDAWDVVVVGGTIAGLRAAIAAHDSGARVTVLEEGAIGSGGSSLSVEGIATSLNETDNKSHYDDTIAVGHGLCDEDVVQSRTKSSFTHISELENWGLVLRRDSNGLPLLSPSIGHSQSRLSSTGDSTGREIYSILEDQCMKRSITRVGDIQVISLVTEDDQIVGLIALDIQNGELLAVQSKSIVLATDGYESAWNGGSGATGLWLAQGIGVELKNLEFAVWNPMFMESYGLQIPLSILNDGGQVRTYSGNNVDFSSSDGFYSASKLLHSSNEKHVLDARILNRGTAPWYADISEKVLTRLGGDMKEVVIPISPRVSTTLGGIPCDENGSVESILGLYAAGDCACSGFHGADMAAGNRLLESLDGGLNSGNSASTYAINRDFSGIESIDSSLIMSANKYASLLNSKDDGITRGQAENKLNSIMMDSMGFTRNTSSLSKAEEQITKLVNSIISLSDTNPIMNTELAEVFRLEGLLNVSKSAIQAAASRHESCGSHQLNE